MIEQPTNGLAFEPTDVFDFDSDGHAQLSMRHNGFSSSSNALPVATSQSRGVSDSAVKEARRGGASGERERRLLSTPSPGVDPEEYAMLEDEIALVELEQEMAELDRTKEEKDRYNANQKNTEINGDFISTGIFDFDEPVASSSRINITPPPDTPNVASPIRSLATVIATESTLVQPTKSCTLPPLLAAIANGGYVSFKRRWKPQIASIQGVRHDGDGSYTGELVTTPLHKLLAQVEELRSKEKAAKLQKQFDREHAQQTEKVQLATSLWVDKYRPKNFADLLGEDRVHRDVMKWLKEWDKCVFKRVPQGKKRYRDENTTFEYFDSLGRPRERVLLLSGPPGYGKTTLASIVAKHAGYKVLEINASDDRSYHTVQTRIKNAIDAGSGLGSEGKPTCVIVDEVDGAGSGEGGFVKALIRLIQDIPAKKKSNSPARPLRRPIICICNDLYAPALRLLRPYARIVRFRKPQAQSLVVRLREICTRENLESDTRSLNSLIEITSGDVRSCLNTLQFIKSRSNEVTEAAIRSSSLGLKDIGSTLQTAWNTLFIPLPTKKRRNKGVDDSHYLPRVVTIVQSCGDYDKLILGAFEHYPNLKPLDATLKNLNGVHGWLEFTDRLQGRVGAEQEWELMGYIPWGIGAWYAHLAAPANNSKLAEYPKADYDAFQTRNSNEEIATAFKANLPPILRCLFSATTTFTELIPLLIRIISPPLNPVNANIVKPAEKALLDRLVDLMIPLGLNFYKEKAENGQPMMRLEPPIDVFVHYEGKRAEDILISRFAARQLVSQSMEAELLRRRGVVKAETGSGTGAKGFVKAYGLKGSEVTNTHVDKTLLPVTDFFGRTVAVIEEEVVGDSLLKAPPQKKFRAIYKFNEGSLSAVRRSIKMSALM
ncbi:hypothetical protein L204_102309 [Cryptococcus depauperatus]